MELDQETDPAFAMALGDGDDDLMDAKVCLVASLPVVPPIPPSIIVQASKKRVVKNQSGPRKRVELDCNGALACLNRDYLGSNPLMGSQSKLQYTMSRSMFQFILEEVMKTGNQFYCKQGVHDRASLEARLLLPIKTMAYGVATHCFSDYFQMTQSLCREACRQFDIIMLELFSDRFLRFPTADNVSSIVSLHQAVHGINGMLGSLDCIKTHWRQCPVAWHWKGAHLSGCKGMPCMVLEVVADHHT
jgi:Plant transposon protein